MRSWISWPRLKTSLYLSLIVLKSRLDRNWKKTTCQICIPFLYVCHTSWRRCITSTDLLNIEDQSNLVQYIFNKNYFVFLLSYIDTPLNWSSFPDKYFFFHPQHKIYWLFAQFWIYEYDEVPMRRNKMFACICIHRDMTLDHFWDICGKFKIVWAWLSLAKLVF